jgi:hypothetical protein
MFKNVDIAEFFNIRNFTHVGWYDKNNTKRKDLIQWIRARYTPQKWRREKYADVGHRLPVRVLKQVVYPFMIQKLSGTQLTK